MGSVWRKAASRRVVAAAAAATVGLLAADTFAATFTYTRTTTSTDLWSAGTAWSSTPNPPTSATDTTLSFGGALTANRTIISNNDTAGNFTLNALSLNFSQSASGASNISVSGGTLEFVTNGDAGPVLTFNTGAGAVKPNVTISSNVLLSNALSIVATSNGAISGVISGANGLTKTGAGTVFASGLANTYTGPTVINEGTLRVNTLANVNTASSIGMGSVDGSAADLVFGGGTLAYSTNTTTTLSTDRLFTIGSATGNSATLDNGTNGIMLFTGTGAVGLANSAAHTLTLTGAASAGNNIASRSKFNPTIGDHSPGNATSVYKTGVAIWDLGGNNTYSGGTFIQEGMLQTSTTTGFGTGLVTVSNGAMASVVGVGTLTNDFSISGIGRSYGLSSVGSTGGAIRLGNGADVSGLITMTGNSRISTGGQASGGAAATISGRITGAFSIEFGTGAAAGHAALVIANSGNDYTGTTTLLSGGANSSADFAVRLGASEVIPHGPGKGNLVISSNRNLNLNLNGFSETVNGLDSASTGLAASRNITNATTIASVLTVGAADGDGSYLGTIQGGANLSLTKIGAGTQSLAGVGGSFAYTGATRVNGGTLNLDFSQQAGGSGTALSNLLHASSRLVLDGGRFRVTERPDGASFEQTDVANTGTTSLTISSAAGLTVGQTLTGTFITPGTYIQRISGNVLTLSAAATSGTGNVTVAAASFTTSQTMAGLDVLSSSSIDFGEDGNSLALTFNGVTHTDGVLTIENWNGTALTGGGADRLIFSGEPTVFTGLFTQEQVQFLGYQPGYTAIDLGSSYEIVPTAVPEPGTLSALALGAVGLLRRTRRRR